MPTGPVTTPTGKEMDFPYPSRALGISFLDPCGGPGRGRGALGIWSGSAWTAGGWRPWPQTRSWWAPEPATNAIQATGLTETDATWNDAGHDIPTFHVRMLLFEASIVIEVWDADPAPPVPQHVTGEKEGGRGLLIVAMLSAKWNWFPAPQGGKVVWAELAIPPRPLTEAGLPLSRLRASRPNLIEIGPLGSRLTMVGPRS